MMRPAWLRDRRAAAACVALLLLATASDASAGNRLAGSTDPYLLLHAQDPVDWYPWGPEALERARREDKPIFLSVGFSSCFWCHTMERESFSDPAIAALMNASFISIKVDREQRPDLDALYGLASDVLTGQFGWPNNVFLTPDGKPFAAGTYLPPHDDSFGQAGFASTVSAMHDLWAQHRAETVAAAQQTVASMAAARKAQTMAGQVALAPEAWMARARTLFLSRLDPVDGGLSGEGGKSPHAPVLMLMLAAQRAHPDPATEAWLRATLDAMAFGGIDDQLGGGFHRTSTDQSWSIPHYEKMLGDNAGLLAAYADASVLLHDSFYHDVALATGRWMLRELEAPEGGFLNSEDSRSGDLEGGSYQWSVGQIRTVLGQSADRFLQVYTISSDQPATDGDVERGVLRVRVPIRETLQRTAPPAAAQAAAAGQTVAATLSALAPERAELLAARRLRAQPLRDSQIVVAENGLAIAALARNAVVLGEPAFLDAARRAGERLWSSAWDERAGLLHHEMIDGVPMLDGALDDYALLADADLELATATGDAKWRERATLVAGAMLHRFVQPEGSLAASTARDLILPPVDTGDDAQPSGTSAAIGVLVRLSGPGDVEAAARAVSWISGAVAARPDSWPDAILATLRGEPALGAVPSGNAARHASAAANDAHFTTPDTADHVHVNAALGRKGGDVDLSVTLRIDPDFHVNANPASSADLIATTLKVSGADLTEIHYPSALTMRPSFTPTTLEVYEGVVEIAATLPAFTARDTGLVDAPLRVNGTVEVQACTMRMCLPPSTLPFTASLP